MNQMNMVSHLLWFWIMSSVTELQWRISQLVFSIHGLQSSVRVVICLWHGGVLTLSQIIRSWWGQLKTIFCMFLTDAVVFVWVCRWQEFDCVLDISSTFVMYGCSIYVLQVWMWVNFKGGLCTVTNLMPEQSVLWHSWWWWWWWCMNWL